ncbi:MAG: hypothetical protein Q8N08_03830 [Methanobacteriaceae archaeon]|nr:hypothetical protein [Methanobacteriaceae archaeon]
MPTPHQEVLVLNALNYFQAEYKEGVPLSILKLDLDLEDDELNQILDKLKFKGSISHLDGKVKLENSTSSEDVSPEDQVEEITVNINDDVPVTKNEKNKSTEVQTDLELSETEKESLKLIKSLVNKSGVVSRHILEGHLLYGDLKLSNLQLYNLLNSLENKGLLSRVLRIDGSYYSLS